MVPEMDASSALICTSLMESLSAALRSSVAEDKLSFISSNLAADRYASLESFIADVSLAVPADSLRSLVSDLPQKLNTLFSAHLLTLGDSSDEGLASSCLQRLLTVLFCHELFLISFDIIYIACISCIPRFSVLKQTL
jgi:hypothetical protein